MSGLKVMFSDRFEEGLDSTTWTTDLEGWSTVGTVSSGDRTARMVAQSSSPAGPGVMAYCGLATRNRQFQSHLSGINLLEVTLQDYTHEGPFLNRYMTADGASSDHEDPISGNYLMGFSLAIGTFRGLVGTGPVSKSVPVETLTHRVVQIHFDWYARTGLWYCLNRNVVSGDKAKLRTWGTDADRKTWRDTHAVECPVISGPGNSVSLAVMHSPLGDHTGWGHRYGLLLADDGNTLSWQMDGKVMATVDITGYFSSSPGCVAEGAYATVVGGAGYQRNVWTVADLRVCGNST